MEHLERLKFVRKGVLCVNYLADLTSFYIYMYFVLDTLSYLGYCGVRNLNTSYMSRKDSVR